MAVSAVDTEEYCCGPPSGWLKLFFDIFDKETIFFPLVFLDDFQIFCCACAASQSKPTELRYSTWQPT